MARFRLAAAIENHDIDALRRGLLAGADPCARDPRSEPPDRPFFVLAVQERGYRVEDGRSDADSVPELVVALLEGGADPNAEWGEGSGYTALVPATRSGDVTTVRLLLERGLDPDRAVLWPPDAYEAAGFTPRLLALQEGHAEVLEAMQAIRALPDGGPVGRWQLAAYEYAGDMPTGAWADPEQPELRQCHLELLADGTYQGQDFTGMPRSGRWEQGEGEDELVLVEEATEERTAVTLDCEGHRLVEQLEDEQTGYRGEASFTYVRSTLLRGLERLEG